MLSGRPARAVWTRPQSRGSRVNCGKAWPVRVERAGLNIRAKAKAGNPKKNSGHDINSMARVAHEQECVERLKETCNQPGGIR